MLGVQQQEPLETGMHPSVGREKAGVGCLPLLPPSQPLLPPSQPLIPPSQPFIPHPNLSSLHPSLSFLYPSLSFLHPSLSSLRPSLSSPLQAAIQRWEQGCRLGGASSELPTLRREGFAGNAVLRLNTSRGAGRGERTLPGFSHAWGSWCLLK